MNRRRLDRRLGRCYELAGRRAFEERGSVLVHGTIGPNLNPHAWVDLQDGSLWEPITEMVLPKDAFDRFFYAVERVRYTWPELTQQIRDHHHWGPWDEA